MDKKDFLLLSKKALFSLGVPERLIGEFQQKVESSTNPISLSGNVFSLFTTSNLRKNFDFEVNSKKVLKELFFIFEQSRLVKF